MTSSSVTTPALPRVGLSSLTPAAGALEPHRSEFHRLQAETAAFVHDVHASRAAALVPMLAALVFGLALMLVAALSPQPRTLKLMLNAESGENLAAVAGSRATPEASYELPPQWQWPALVMPPAPALRLACDPALTGGAC